MAQLVRTLLVKENRPLTAQEFSGLGIHQKKLEDCVGSLDAET